MCPLSYKLVDKMDGIDAVPCQVSSELHHVPKEGEDLVNFLDDLVVVHILAEEAGSSEDVCSYEALAHAASLIEPLFVVELYEYLDLSLMVR